MLSMKILDRKEQMRRSLAEKAQMVSCVIDSNIGWDINMLVCRVAFQLAGLKCAAATWINPEFDEETRQTLIDDFANNQARASVLQMLRGRDQYLIGPKGKLPA